MTALILDGKALARTCEANLAARVKALQRDTAPVLTTVLVGDDPASATYVRMKGNACQRVGVEPRALRMSAQTSTEELLHALGKLNSDPSVCGILLQHPVPPQIDERVCFDAIAPEKDVDGVTSLGYGRLSMGLPAWGSCTPRGIMRLLEHYGIDLVGMDALVVGRSPILGKPMAAMLTNADATVTLAHSRTKDLREKVQQAGLLVAAAGKPHIIPAQWIREGAVVIDAGYHPELKCGDVEGTGLPERCRAYTPVPGGVGPMTINTLIEQTVAQAERSNAIA